MIKYLVILILILAGISFVSNPATSEINNSSYNVTAGDALLMQDSTIIPLEISQPIPGNDINFDYVFMKYELDLSVWNEKDDKNCEKLAKMVQQKYGGSLIFLVGKDANNNYILGDYAGHFLNKLYDKDLKKYLYIDYQLQFFTYTPDLHAEVFKNANNYADVEVFDMGEGRPPFNMIWHY